MSGSQNDDKAATEQARTDLERAEAGDAAGAQRLRRLEKSDQGAATEAVEQVASDGPEGRGLER